MLARPGAMAGLLSTPLLSRGHIDIMKRLMHYAVLLDVKTDDGHLPIDVALNEDVRQAFNDEEKRRRDHGFKRAV
jgi:hypothetical protein